MFTGIVEKMAQVRDIREVAGNVQVTLEAHFEEGLKIDQSVSHNGVCLTVDGFPEKGTYTVTAIPETLRRTNLGQWKPGDWVNVERCLPAHGRFDGHMVQGHVDTTATLREIIQDGGSFELIFNVSLGEHLLVPKGSICVNGVSLTLVQTGEDFFSVAIIPYTWEHTNLGQLKPGEQVNIEFDILGKYMVAWMKRSGITQLKP
jgi:riboflavin synthase